MPRKESLEVRLYCLKCKDFTQSIGPIIVSKLIKKIDIILKLNVQFVINLNLNF